jgi:PAS domain S-box-containing protein
MPAMASPGHESERLNALLLVDSIPALIHTAKPDGYIDYFNKPWLEYLGVTLDKVAGWNWTAVVHPEDVEGIVAKWRACLGTGEVFEYETRVRSANGEYRWMFHRKVPLRDANGNIVKWYGSSLDIDERKTAEQQLRRNAEELRRSEFYLSEGQRLAHMGSWAFDPDGFYYWSPELFRMHGLDPANKPPSFQEYLDRVHQRDRESMADLIKGILAKASTFDATKRIVRPNGELRYIRCVGAPVVENQCLKKYVGSAIDVTEHELLTQELRRREAYLTEAQRLSHTGSFGWKPDTGEIVWSDETYRIFEYDCSVKPTIDSVVQRVHPEDRADLEEVINRAFAGATDFEHSYRLLLPDGRVKHVHAIAHVLQDASGNREFVGAVTDITERKTTEDKIRRLVEADILGIFIANVQGLIVEANQAFLQMLQYGRDDLVSGRLHWTDLTPAELRERDERALTEALATGVFQPYEKEFLRKDGSRLPVLIGGALFQGANEGVVFILDLSDQKRAEEALRTSEAYLAEAQRLSHTGSWAWSPDTDVRHWSEECYRVLGFDPRDSLPRMEEFIQRIHPDDQPAFRESAKRAKHNKLDEEVDYRIVHPGGAVRDIHSIGHPVFGPRGDLIEYTGTVIDVTERKRAEEELRASERKYRRLVDTTPAFIHTALPDGSLDFLSRGWLEYGGLPQTDFLDWRWTAAIHPDDVEGFVDKWRAALASGEPFEDESRVRRADGEYRWFLQRNVPLRDETGKIVKWYGTGVDIEERKRAEESLRRSESYLAEAQRLSQTGSWAWSPDQDIRYWSEECYRVLSFDPQDGLPRFEEFLQRLHPDDQPGFRELIQRAIREKTEWQADYRIVHPDGPVRDIHVVAHPVLSTSGHLVEFVGTVIDVTERKQAEEELRRSEMELRQIVDLVPQVVAVFGPGGERLYANRIGLDYAGLSLEEWRQAPGNAFSSPSFFHPDDRERATRTFYGSARPGGSAFELELRLRKRDGSYRWFLARYNPLSDKQGQITRWYVAFTDIEDRKQAEDRLRGENVALREEIDKASMFDEIVGTSPALKAVLSRISKVAPSDSTVLVTGETGTGKELVARAIHRRSDRASRAFVSVNCAAIPRDLIASELFGHEKGAFTGATQQRPGRFELANGGTLFLDEVGELPAETQIALLRVLQEHEFERVGGSRRIRADVRVIAATNRDLQAAISAGSFRSDLFYRLHVFPIDMPSLRERREDIPLLVEYFIDRYARKDGKHIKRVNKKTLELLQSYAWPGNIRELQNVIERSVILCETEIFSIDESWLPKQPSLTEPKNPMELPGRLLAQEKDMIEAALKESRGRIFGPTGAAAKLGIPRSTLESKIRSLKINKNRFRPASGT